MKLTNKYGHDDVFIEAIKNDPYSRGDSEYSATSLIKPARIARLEEIHQEELTEDVEDIHWKLLGQLGHLFLERAGRSLSHKITEKRLFGEIDGVKISAQIDSLCLNNDCLTDYKFTKVAGFTQGTSPKNEWTMQLNIQLELLRINGMDANKLRICGVLVDWRPSEARVKPGYPRKISYHDLPMWPRETTVDLIRKLIKKHRAAKEILPFCSSIENWNGNRCYGYCLVNSFCDQYKQRRKK